MIKLTDVVTCPAAVDVLWDLMVERSVDPTLNISHRELPTKEEHEKFVYGHHYREWCLLSVDDDWVGSVSLTWRNEVGVVLFEAHRGKGYGKAALEVLLGRYEPLPAIKGERQAGFIANINPDNERSIRLFASLGFRLLQQTYVLERP